MVYYLIILFYFIISIYCQQVDEVVECHTKNITQDQLDKMTIDQQERIVNKIFSFFIYQTYRADFQCISFSIHVELLY